MKRKLTLIIFIIVGNMEAYCQFKSDSISHFSDKMVSIYEYGDRLTFCETNFENLFRNWHNGYITNANEYSFDNYSFVETISDSARYRYYCNYFSGLEVVNNYYSSFASSSSYKGKQMKTRQEYFITPFKYKWFLLERFPIEAVVKMLKLYNTEINLDTIKLKTVFQEKIQTIEKQQDGDSSYHSHSRIRKSGIWAYSDSVTKKCIDSMLIHQLPLDDLSIQSQGAILTEQALLMRVGMQERFNEEVHLGDRVYLVPFQFGGYQFKVFVICNPVSKKVVMDYFFKNIRLPAKK